MTYVPRQGDIITMNFSPQSGHEQAGARPALVVSNDSFFKFTHMAIVCPIERFFCVLLIPFCGFVFKQAVDGFRLHPRGFRQPFCCTVW